MSHIRKCPVFNQNSFTSVIGLSIITPLSAFEELYEVISNNYSTNMLTSKVKRKNCYCNTPTSAQIK